GNEVNHVVKDPTVNGPCQKKFIRDMRAFIKKCNSKMRPIPVGVVLADTNRSPNALYYNCRTDPKDTLENAEWYGINVYLQCDPKATVDKVGDSFKLIHSDFQSYKLAGPTMLTEFGCLNEGFPTVKGYAAQRPWVQASWLLSKDFSDVFTGGFAFEFSTENANSKADAPYPFTSFGAQNYGLGYFSPETCDHVNTTCKYNRMPNFDNLAKYYTGTNTTLPSASDYTEFVTTTPSCPSGFSTLKDSTWAADAVTDMLCPDLTQTKMCPGQDIITGKKQEGTSINGTSGSGSTIEAPGSGSGNGNSFSKNSANSLVTGVSAIMLALSQVWSFLTAPGFKVDGKHVVITGGSTGLGLATAKKYAKAGAKVTIIARSMDALEKAKAEIQAIAKHPVFIQSCDVTNFESVQKAVAAANTFHNRVTDHVVCCAGAAMPGYFFEQDISIFRKEMDLNYFGVVHATKAALPAMIERNEGGTFVFVSSGCGLLSFIGYTQYCPTKFAVRGFADALRNEFKLYKMNVHIFYPGNIDSPGFIQENKTKPAECKEIEGSADLLSPDQVAQSMIDGVANGVYAITNDIGIWLLRVIGNGINPRKNTILEMALLPLLTLVQIGFVAYMDYVVGKYRSARAKKEKTN
ncbi:3-ketodihydrosphingosine reductase, partial [Thraustotheca clavata]